MFRIKICGITSVEDALMVAGAGADAIGLNFYAGSPRFVNGNTALDIAAALPGDVLRVGLFVDTPADEICRLFDYAPLDLIQLHGDQAPEFIQQLGNRPVIRAFRIERRAGIAPPTTDAVLLPVTDYLARCRKLSAVPAMVLLDAMAAGQFGGTGKTTDWRAAAKYAQQKDVPPLVLAGGLTPHNVAEAIKAVHPAAVDTAGGVESSPGRKDPDAAAQFVKTALAAFNR